MASEKPLTRVVHNKRNPVLTLLGAIVAFVLSLIALLSNGKNGQLSNYDVVMVSIPFFSPSK
jgi:hypothetical protein